MWLIISYVYVLLCVPSVPRPIAQCWPLFLWNSSWTFFHQDGNGTVDSGHQCLTGRNHVVMLRRLNEEDKKRAMRILGGDLCYREDRESHGKGGSQGAKGGTRGGDSLYELPHGPGQKPPWPSDKVIKLLREVSS